MKKPALRFAITEALIMFVVITAVFAGPWVVKFLYDCDLQFIPRIGDETTGFGYYASTLGCLGAVFIGIVTIAQSRYQSQIADERIQQLAAENSELRHNHRLSLIGFFHLEYLDKDDQGNFTPRLFNLQVQMPLTNTSNNAVEVLGSEVYLGRESRSNSSNRRFYPPGSDYLSKYMIAFGLDEDDLDDEIGVQIQLLLSTITGYKYLQILNVTFDYDKTYAPEKYYRLSLMETKLLDGNRLPKEKLNDLGSIPGLGEKNVE